MRIGPIRGVRFDPNARDGDNDGLVQEQTPYERPKTPSKPDAPKNKPLKIEAVSPASDLPRTRPLRATNISTEDIQKGGLLKASNLFEADILKKKNRAQRASLLGVSGETIDRMMQDDASLDSFAADRLATNGLGMHPMQVWGEDWLTADINAPKLNKRPPRSETQRETEMLDIRSSGATFDELSKRYGLSRQRVQQILKNATQKRDQRSLREEKIEDDNLAATARQVSQAVFNDTGVSPDGLIGRMSSEITDNHPIFETEKEREDREQSFQDHIDKIVEDWELSRTVDGLDNPVTNDYLDFIESLDKDEVRKSFEEETGMDSWGLDFDEDGFAEMTYWAKGGYLSEEDYFDWDSSPMSEVVSAAREDYSKGNSRQPSLFEDTGFEKYKEDPRYKIYGGDINLLKRNSDQLEKFQKWTADKDWPKFHSEHYDWWAYPIDSPSHMYGEEFNLPQQNLKSLRKNKEFLKSVSESISLVAQSYAWDIKSKNWLDNPDINNDQLPQSLSQVRLYKMAKSALEFGLCNEFDSLVAMYENLVEHGWNFRDEGFWSAKNNCSQSKF